MVSSLGRLVCSGLRSGEKRYACSRFIVKRVVSISSGSSIVQSREPAITRMSALGRKRTFVSASRIDFAHISQRLPLSALLVEVLHREPGLERALQLWPLLVDDGIPRRIAVTSLVDNCLTEDSLELEAKSLSRLARGRIETVALPFVATIPKLVENVRHEKELRFGRHCRVLEQRRKHYRAHLNNALFGINPHQGQSADRFARFAVDDCVVSGIGAARCFLGIATVGFRVVERSDGHVGPVAMIRCITVPRK